MEKDFTKLHQSNILELKLIIYLDWHDHINNIAIKLTKANAMLYKVTVF